MGLLNKMFGGGTGVEVQLDATQVPIGGVLSGRAIVKGGKKDLELNALKVRLLYVSVKSRDDSPMPEIDTRVLIDNTLVSNKSLPAGSTQEYSFQIPIPDGTEPTAHNVSYKVVVAADIPKVADPTAEATLKVIEGEVDGDAIASLEEIYSRWPALRGSAPDPLVDALWDFSSECYSEREKLVVAEPILANLARTGTGRVREAAIGAWANLLDGQVRKENLRLLEDLSKQDLDSSATKKVVEAAAKFADEGGLPILTKFVDHPDPEVRREVANALRFQAADKFNGKKEFLWRMAQDQDPAVRASAYSAFNDFLDDPQVVQHCIQHIEVDPSPDVQAAIIDVLGFAHHHGHLETVLAVYSRHLQNQHEKVRKEIGERLHWLPAEQAPRIYPIVQALLADQSEEVRRSTAWHFRNMSDFPSLAPLLQHTIANDPSPKVRKDALGALATVVPMADAIAFYQVCLQHDPTEDTYWAVMDGVRFRKEPEARAMLQTIAQSQFASVARAAREALAYEN